MADYAALVSLAHILRQILQPPPLTNIIIDRQQIEFLRRKVDFVIDFLETYSSSRNEQLKDLEMRIADAAYAAEDIIESNVIEQICATDEGKISANLFEGIQTVVEEFVSIEKELIKMEETLSPADLQPKSSTAATSARPLPGGKIVMVGLDKHLNAIMGALATDESNRQIIPIVGMGGIGKTTLATAIYNNSFVIEHFHIRAWVTVSQEYSIRELFIRLLSEINKPCSDKQDDELGLRLHRELFDRKYLIVLDDMWSIQVWDKLKMFLPPNGNGSRILITTRLSSLADEFGSCTPYKMDFLDDGQSWDLLSKTIFADEDCPVDLEEIGKEIAERCGGLPLALVVIGGLLAKSERTSELWESIAGDVTSALNYGNDEHLTKILSLSYIHLPLYLKPCFLYLAMFPEDFEIYVTRLIRSWVAEGVIKHTQAKCFEEVAHEYLDDLISRNLILVHKRGSSGKVNCCKLHDLIRDLCIKEAERIKFLYNAKLDNPSMSPNIETKRRLTLSSASEPVEIMAIEGLQSSKFSRSLLSHCKLFGYDWWIREGSMGDSSRKLIVDQVIHGFKLLKVVHVNDHEVSIDILKLCNLRYVAARSASSILSMSLCWNLQTLVVDLEMTLPTEFWQMPQLRHLRMSTVTIPDPPDDENVVVLENLQTLATVKNLKCTEQVSRRIPNLKKLRIEYYFESSTTCEQAGNCCLKNHASFEKLESLFIECPERLRTDLAFPISLKKLKLAFCKIPWEDLSIVGSLPNLEVLKLYRNATKGEEWNPVEGEFCRLKFLMICDCELNIWGAEDYHFPVLERLVLNEMKLEELPMSFSEILTLQAIELYPTDSPLWSSAMEISEEREQLGYEPLQLREL